MQLQKNALIVAGIYVAVIGAGGVGTGITSAAAWVSLGALALLPGCSILLIWSQRTQPPPATTAS